MYLEKKGLMDIKITDFRPNSINNERTAKIKSKKTSYGKLEYNECRRAFFARGTKSKISILLKSLSEENDYNSSYLESPVNFFVKSAEIMLDNHLDEIEIIGSSALRSISQIGSACFNHRNGILIYNSPWSQEILKLEANIKDSNKTTLFIKNSNPSEQKLFELINYANFKPNSDPGSIQVSLPPGQCLLLDSKRNLIKRISFCSDFLCKYSSNLKSNNISLFASSGSRLDTNNFFLNSRNMAAAKCHQYFSNILENLISIENQLYKIFERQTLSQLFKTLTLTDSFNIKNHSKSIFNKIDLPMLNMCISASAVCDPKLSTMINCNSFASDSFYRKFLSNWIIHWSPYL